MTHACITRRWRISSALRSITMRKRMDFPPARSGCTIGSMPGILKNVIDWVSRFRPQPFNGKQAFLLSASPSMAGGNRGLWALRVPLEHLGSRVYPDMFSLAQAHQAFDAQGKLASPQLVDRLDQSIAGFMDLAEAAKNYPCAKTAWVEFLGEHPNSPIDRVDKPESATTNNQ